jgi:hypothetical protein
MKIPAKLAAAVAAQPPTKRRVPFREFPCVLHRSHKPVPSRTELHHRFPLYLQAKCWPDVDPDRPTSARDKERIPVCEGGHTDVHVAINALLLGAPLPKGVGRAEKTEAAEAVRRFRDSKPIEAGRTAPVIEV